MDSLLILGIGLLCLGVLLIVLEAFVPSGGLLGISALISAVAGIVFLFRYEPIWGAIGLLMTVILGPMAFMSALKLLPSTNLGRTMVGQSGDEIARAREESTRARRDEREQLVGLEGIAKTDMRPSGVIVIDGKQHDAVAAGAVIDRDQRVEVVAVDGFTVTVRPIG